MPYALQIQWELKLSESKDRKHHSVLIGVGSNIEPVKNIRHAMALLAKKVEIQSCSRVWQNPAVGSDGPDYLNAAVFVHSQLDLEEMKSALLRPLEASLDRQRTEDKNADRTIDLDILIYDGQSLDEELWTQPHVSIPSAELMPDFRHPETGETLSEAAARLRPENDFLLRSDLDPCQLYQ